MTLSPWSLSYTCEAGGASSSPVPKTRGSWMAAQSNRGSSTRDVMAAQKWKLRVQGAREKDMFVDNNGSAHKLFAPVSCRTERWTMVISDQRG